MKREIFWAVIRENSHIFTWNRVVYDDMNIMFAMDRIKFENGRDSAQFEVRLHLSGEFRIREFLVKLDLITNHDLQVDLSQLASQPHTFSNRVPLQCIDILLTQSKRCTLLQFASEWYAESHTVFRIPTELKREFDLGASKELWRGMFISTNVGEGWKPMVNLDGNEAWNILPRRRLLKVMCEVCKRDTSDLLHDTSLGEQQIRQLEKKLKGLKFITEHCGGKRRLRCQGIGEAPNIYKFDYNGSMITIEQYFSDVYDIQLRYPSLPTLVVGTERAVRRQYVPIELCKLDRPQKDNKPLDKKLQANVVQKTTTIPRERKSIINELRRALENDVFMNSFGLNLNGDMMECEGRVLPIPPVKQFAQNASISSLKSGRSRIPINSSPFTSEKLILTVTKQ